MLKGFSVFEFKELAFFSILFTFWVFGKVRALDAAIHTFVYVYAFLDVIFNHMSV
jgi:hypothetical protein